MNIAQTIPVADTWGMHGDIGAGWGIVMMILMVLFWGAIILGVVWLVRRGFDARPERQTPTERPTPTEVLDHRFAQGEISVEDYRARREVLVNGNAGSHDEPRTAPPAEGGRT